MTPDEAIAALSRDGHRITRTRQLILEALASFQGGSFSAQDILQAIRPQRKGRSIDLVTVYRNLPVFETSGIICRSDFSGETARFVLASAEHRHHHHHIVCRSCHRVEAVDFCAIKGQEKILTKLGFRDIHHRLEFSGICRACTKSATAALK